MKNILRVLLPKCLIIVQYLFLNLPKSHRSRILTEVADLHMMRLQNFHLIERKCLITLGIATRTP